MPQNVLETRLSHCGGKGSLVLSHAEDTVPAELPQTLEMRVLLVDDQPIFAQIVRRVLHQELAEFAYCQDGGQALTQALAFSPTIILQDLVMPGIDGLDLVRHYREQAALRDVPIIVLSSREEATVKAQAFATGANDYLVKLPDKLELLARLKYHSQGYVHLQERNSAYQALLESQRQLEQRNRFIREIFGRYVDDSVVETILATPDGVRVGGEKRLVTVLMSDLRGFTSLCERLTPEMAVRLLNRYLEQMTEVIQDYRGVVVEFIGDAIIVLFGAPVSAPDDAQRAVACALAMQQAMPALNAKSRASELPELAMGIGLHTGEAIIGNIGSQRRLKYDVIGHTVNLAARIESYSVGGQVLISTQTLDACGGVVQIAGEFQAQPKGVREPIMIYRIDAIGGAFNISLPTTEADHTIWCDLNPPLAVEFAMVEGKHLCGPRYRGELVRLGTRGAWVRAPRGFRPLTQLQCLLCGEDGSPLKEVIYARVIGQVSQASILLELAFSALPAELSAVLDRSPHQPQMSRENPG